MKVKCEFCSSIIEDSDKFCEYCGAVNENYGRNADLEPETIAELQSWYKARNLPPFENTRFFIGVNYKEPKAYGIYEDNGIFTVYKNKADGERVIRYQGGDEEYAVKEIHLRLKEEILRQKANKLKK